VECLAAVVNHVTLNYKIVRDLYERFWKILVDAASHFREDNQNLMRINRALCIVALVVQHFDIESEAFGYVSSNIKDRLVDVFLALLKHPNPTVQCKSLQSLGFIFIRKPETMMQNKIASIYAAMLNPNNDNVDMKQIVLANLVRYVEHEESLIADIEEHTTAQEQYANLDLRGNQTSTAELPRKIIYHYLKSILLCGLDAEMDIRREVLNLISAVVRLRFSNPQLVKETFSQVLILK
jgi:cohesin loading factor subunit SCC2